MGAKVSAAPKQLRIPQPSRLTGQMGMTRKECEENHPTRMQGRGTVLDRKEGVPSTPVTEIGKETVGPKWKIKIE